VVGGVTRAPALLRIIRSLHDGTFICNAQPTWAPFPTPARAV